MRVVGLLLGLIVGGAALLYTSGTPNAFEQAKDADAPRTPNAAGPGVEVSLQGSGHASTHEPEAGSRKPPEVEGLLLLAQTGEAEEQRAALRKLSRLYAADRIPLKWLVGWALIEVPEGASNELVDWALELLAEDKWNAQELLPDILAVALGAGARKQEAVARVVETLEEVASTDVPAIVRIFEHEQSEYELKRVLVEAMRVLGEDALPAAPGLIAFAARTMKERVADEARAAAAGIDISWDLVEYDVERLLASMGDSVVPLLVKRFRAAHRIERAESDTPIHARDPASILAGALANAGEAGLRAVISFTQDPSARQRGLAVFALASLDARNELVRGALLGALQDNEPGIRAQAARALEGHGSASVPALVRALTDEDLRVRSAAAGSLSTLEVDPKDALDPLVQMLAEDDDKAAVTAAGTLSSFGAGAVSVLPKLVARLATDDEGFRGPVALAVAKVAIHDPDAFAKHWTAASPQIRRGLVRALAAIAGEDEHAPRKPSSPLDPRFANLVTQALRDRDIYVRVYAARLRAKNHGDDAVLPILTEGFMASDGHVRTIAIEGLEALGRPARHLLPEMFKRIVRDDLYADHGKSEARALDRAIDALGPFDLPRMFAVIDHQASTLSYPAKRTFLSAGPTGFTWLASNWQGARLAQKLAALDVAHNAFQERGSAAQPLRAAAARLAELALKDADVTVRVKAVQALESDPPSLEMRLDALMGLLDVQDAKIASGAARSLIALGKRVRAVATELEARKDHPNEAVRRAI